MTIDDQAYALFQKLNREQRNLFGGPPFTQEIARERRNYCDFIAKRLPNRKRICLATVMFDPQENVIGYQATTIMNGAKPTQYEHDNIGLIGPLNYVQLKKILVDPNYFGKNVAARLFFDSLEFTNRGNKQWVTDVKEENERMIGFLHKYGAKEVKTWNTQKGSTMIRFAK